MNTRNLQDYEYDPATGTYVLARRAPPGAPPRPPKELDLSAITKESQQLAELEGDMDAGSARQSSDSLSARQGERDRKERRGSRPGGKVKFNVEPRKRRQLRILSLGTLLRPPPPLFLLFSEWAGSSDVACAMTVS